MLTFINSQLVELSWTGFSGSSKPSGCIIVGGASMFKQLYRMKQDQFIPVPPSHALGFGKRGGGDIFTYSFFAGGLLAKNEE
jgi:hypothetical protein